jgi:uncharacterized protein YerC
MKRKDPALAAALGPKPRSQALERLIEAMLALRTSKELHAFLDDLCTPACQDSNDARSRAGTPSRWGGT